MAQREGREEKNDPSGKSRASFVRNRPGLLGQEGAKVPASGFRRRSGQLYFHGRIAVNEEAGDEFMRAVVHDGLTCFIFRLRFGDSDKQRAKNHALQQALGERRNMDSRQRSQSRCSLVCPIPGTIERMRDTRCSHMLERRQSRRRNTHGYFFRGTIPFSEPAAVRSGSGFIGWKTRDLYTLPSE